MTAIDQLTESLLPNLRGVSARELNTALQGLEFALEAGPRRRTQLTLRRLRFEGQKSGDFRFHSGVNVVRAGNDKGKSSLLKLIHFCLTGKRDFKKDVDSWIAAVELQFELDGVAHTIAVEKGRRARGRLVRGDFSEEFMDPVAALADREQEILVEWRSGKEMQEKLEGFFNHAFGLRPLMGTQKDPRKRSDALLDSTTSYRAYVRGMYVTQDMGYTSLVTDGVPYGNLFMKVVGMLLGLRGIDAFFAVEARRAHLENELGKEERYHRRLEESFGLRDLATLDEEIDKLERYIDELKVERTALLVRATSGDLDRRLTEATARLVGLDNVRQQLSERLRQQELELSASQRQVEELQGALAAHRTFTALQPSHCPVCEIALEARQRLPEPEDGQCLLCHEDMPEPLAEGEMAALVEERLSTARKTIEEQRRGVESLRSELEEASFKIEQHTQQKRHLQAQLRSAHQGTEELEREIELETRYLGRLEGEREQASRMVAGDGNSLNIRRLSDRKQILDAVLRYLRTHHAQDNERVKQEFAKRVQAYCTTMGFPGLEEVRLDAQLKPQVRQHGRTYSFDELSPGEKVRFVLAFHLAMAIATGEDLEHGAHPGLLLIDSPGKEEMVQKDFEAVVDLLNHVEQDHEETIQVVVATSIPAIVRATASRKQVFLDDDDRPLFD